MDQEEIECRLAAVLGRPAPAQMILMYLLSDDQEALMTATETRNWTPYARHLADQAMTAVRETRHISVDSPEYQRHLAEKNKAGEDGEHE